MAANKGDQGFDSASTEAPAVRGNKAPCVTHDPALQLYTYITSPVTSGKQGASDENKRWFRNLLTEADGRIMEHSGKMVLLFKILRLAAELEEKVYVFFTNPMRR